ncbi:hypothetical protein [Methylomonas sp. CM2]
MKNQLEAIKLLKDWSTWLVTVQTGVLGLFGLQGKTLNDLTLTCFIISIVIATFILGALPSILQRSEDDSNIHQMILFEWFPAPLYVAAFLQHILFIIGVIYLACSIK